jgi:hypothetical protein
MPEGLERCPFEKPIMSAQCGCTLAVRSLLAERVSIDCRSAAACARCRQLRELFRAKARFALKVTESGARLPFGKELRAMLGGLQGLAALLAAPGAESAARAEDIDALVRAAEARYGGLDRLPFETIVRAIGAHPGRRRGAPGTRP